MNRNENEREKEREKILKETIESILSLSLSFLSSTSVDVSSRRAASTQGRTEGFASNLAVPISLTFFVAFNPTMLDKVIKNVCMFSMNSFLLSLALSRSLSLNKKSERKNERIFGH